MTVLGLAGAELRNGPVGKPIYRLLEEAVRETSAAEGTVWLLSEDRLQLEGVVNLGRTPSVVEQMAVPVAASVIGLVASSGLATCIGPDDSHHPDVDRRTGTVTRAMAAAPIRCHDQVVGVVSAINPADVHGRFSGADLDTLEWKALLIGLVLDARPADVVLPD